MKNLILIACLLISTACFAQHDYCKDIKKEGSAAKGYTKYKSPKKIGSPSIFITKTITGGKAMLMMDFAVEGDKQKGGVNGLLIRFSDGQELNLPGFKASAVDIGFPAGYLYTASLQIDATNAASLIGKTIVGYKVGTAEEKITNSWGEKFKNWLICINDIK